MTQLFALQGTDGYGETDDSDTSALDSILGSITSLGNTAIQSAYQPTVVSIPQVYPGLTPYAAPAGAAGSNSLVLLVLLGVAGFLIFKNV